MGAIVLCWWCWQPITRTRFCGVIICSSRSGRCSCQCCCSRRSCHYCFGSCCLIDSNNTAALINYNLTLPGQSDLLSSNSPHAAIPSPSPSPSRSSIGGSATRASSVAASSSSHHQNGQHHHRRYTSTGELLLAMDAPRPSALPYDNNDACCASCADICSRCCYIWCAPPPKREHTPLLRSASSSIRA
jgi:hypothetical protein